MELGAFLRRGALLALLACGGCEKSDPLGRKAAKPAKTSADATLAPAATRPTATKPGPKRDDSRTATRPAELPPVAMRGSLLHRLPKTTLVALRLPHVDRLDDAWRRTPLHSLLEMPQFVEPREQMEAGFAQMCAELEKHLPDFERLKRKVLALDGELVIALVSLDAGALVRRGAQPDGWPVTLALLYDAGEQAADVEELLQTCFAALEKKLEKEPGRELERVASGKDFWHRRMKPDGGCIDLVREGTQYVLHFGPAASANLGGTPLAKRALEDSFLATDIVRATPELGRDATLAVAELFVNLAPVWTAVEMLAPPDVKNVLTGSGATSIGGISLAAGLGRSGIDETLLIHAPTGKDLLTQVLTNRPLQPRLARFIPADAKMTSISAFDLAALYDGVVKLVPPAERKQLERTLADMKSQGFDLRGDLLGNVGPTFGFVGGLDFWQLIAAQAGQGPLGGGRTALDFTFLVELQDAPRFKRMLERLFRSTGAAAHIRPEVVQGAATSRLESFPIPGPDGQMLAVIEPSWHVAEDALVFSTSNAALERALAAARDASNRGPARMKEAFAQHGSAAWAISTTAAADGLPESMSLGRRTPFGLELTSREGPGVTTAYLLGAGSGVLGAVAIPKLLSARTEANEKAAVATLRSIASAQALFRANVLVDQDGDGRGEFGTLAELTGTAALPGGKPPVSPPVLSVSMTPDARGCFTKAGYVFRVDVPRRAIGGADAAEQRFVAYAWPITAGSTGGKVYVIDAEATIFFTDNRGDEQHYQGQERVPATDAAELRDDNSRVVGVTAVRRGRDGGIWLEHE